MHKVNIVNYSIQWININTILLLLVLQCNFLIHSLIGSDPSHNIQSIFSLLFKPKYSKSWLISITLLAMIWIIKKS